MECVRSLWGSRYAVVDVVWFLVGDSNDKNDGFGWQQYKGEFQWRSDKGLMRLAGGKG